MWQRGFASVRRFQRSGSIRFMFRRAFSSRRRAVFCRSGSVVLRWWQTRFLRLYQILRLLRGYWLWSDSITLEQAAGTKDGKPALLMILEHLQDPGNLGTIIRAGEGAGVTGVIMDASTADIYNPKVIRSTMGSVLRVPFVYTEDLCGTLQWLKKQDVRLFAAHLKGKNSYEQENYCQSTGFLIGNEANGLSDEAASLADTYIRIPMAGRVESLNAAVAASVLMFEAARQRRQ